MTDVKDNRTELRGAIARVRDKHDFTSSLEGRTVEVPTPDLATVLEAASRWAELGRKIPEDAPWAIDDCNPPLLVRTKDVDTYLARCDPNGCWFDDYGEELSGVVGWLRWSGRLRVLTVDNAGIAVEFDAWGMDSGEKQYIFDRAVLTPKQFTDWTGEEPPPRDREVPAPKRGRGR